jgi:hypothetical protein
VWHKIVERKEKKEQIKKRKKSNEMKERGR